MPDNPLTIYDALAWAMPLLGKAGVDTPRLDSQLLLAWTLKLRREDLAREPERVLNIRSRVIFEKAVELRVERRPLPYITGEAWFYGRQFKVNRAVLIPRPETELLVEIALDEFRSVGSPSNFWIADIGTGSGCIAVSLACEIPNYQIIATDISPLALRIAEKNRTRYHCENLELREGDLLDSLGDEEFDLIVSNPPYIPESDSSSLMPEVRDYEPSVALYETSSIRQRLVEQAFTCLKPNGVLAFEIGIGQREGAEEDTKKAGFGDIKVYDDLSGIGRVVSGRKIG